MFHTCIIHMIRVFLQPTSKRRRVSQMHGCLKFKEEFRRHVLMILRADNWSFFVFCQCQFVNQIWLVMSTTQQWSGIYVQTIWEGPSLIPVRCVYDTLQRILHGPPIWHYAHNASSTCHLSKLERRTPQNDRSAAKSGKKTHYAHLLVPCQ